jgi:imidazolonepropionase-like amidohydrolase
MNILLTLIFALSLAIPPDGKPAARQGTFALTNARIETVTHGTIERGTLVIVGDRIVAMGPDAAIPAGAEVIDLQGMTIYPGMIDSGTRLGLVEVGSLPETRDFQEIGDLTPHVRVLAAINPNSVQIPVTRVSGVTTVLSEPSGGLLPGTASVINLHGYTPDHMYAGSSLIKLGFPASGRRGFQDRRSDEEVEREAREAMERLDEVWNRAELFERIRTEHASRPDGTRRPEYVPEMEALGPVLRGEMPLMIEVNAAADIVKALDWVEERGFRRVILSGVSEGWRVADRIAASGIPVLTGPVISLPSRQSDRYDRAYANAGLMHRAGVTVAIRSGNSENVRNLPYHAGFAATYGLGREEALRAITINPARIFGIDGDLGSLEVGKKATLFVADGDPFETRTQVHAVFIDGYLIPLVSRHTRLYDEFLNRYPGVEN